MCARKWQSVERCSFIMKKFKFSTEKKLKRDSLRDPSQIRVDLLVINLFKCLLWETGIYWSFQIVKQRAFERAIASEEKEEAPLTNYENITVNINYLGFASSFFGRFLTHTKALDSTKTASQQLSLWSSWKPPSKRRKSFTRDISSTCSLLRWKSSESCRRWLIFLFQTMGKSLNFHTIYFSYNGFLQ